MGEIDGELLERHGYYFWISRICFFYESGFSFLGIILVGSHFKQLSELTNPEEVGEQAYGRHAYFDPSCGEWPA